MLAEIDRLAGSAAELNEENLAEVRTRDSHWRCRHCTVSQELVKDSLRGAAKQSHHSSPHVWLWL